jgi:hypothetical protein
MDEREALRQRLYRPDASAEDRARYARLMQETAPASSPAPPASRRGPRVAVASAVVLGVAITVLIGRSVAAPERAVADLPPAPTASTILPSERVAVSIDGLAKTGERVHGSGTVEVPLDVSGAPFGGGRFSVQLSSSDGRVVGWTASTLETRRDWSSYRRQVAAGPARDRFAATRADEIAYTGDPPRWITVQAPADAVWSLTIAFGDGHAATLH